MEKTDIETIQAAIETSRALVTKIQKQMASDVQAGVLSRETLKCHATARDNFDAAAIQLGAGNLEDTLHHLLRGSWNLGEFFGRSRKEKEAAQN